jgi:hypothetical protein
MGQNQTTYRIFRTFLFSRQTLIRFVHLMVVTQTTHNGTELWHCLCAVNWPASCDRTSGARNVVSWEFIGRTSWGNWVRAGSGNTHRLVFLHQNLPQSRPPCILQCKTAVLTQCAATRVYWKDELGKLGPGGLRKHTQTCVSASESSSVSTSLYFTT